MRKFISILFSNHSTCIKNKKKLKPSPTLIVHESNIDDICECINLIFSSDNPGETITTVYRNVQLTGIVGREKSHNLPYDDCLCIVLASHRNISRYPSITDYNKTTKKKQSIIQFMTLLNRKYDSNIHLI